MSNHPEISERSATKATRTTGENMDFRCKMLGKVEFGGYYLKCKRFKLLTCNAWLGIQGSERYYSTYTHPVCKTRWDGYGGFYSNLNTIFADSPKVSLYKKGSTAHWGHSFVHQRVGLDEG